MRYRVELGELVSFIDQLQSFVLRAEALASRIDGQVACLHTAWSGDAAEAHRAQHDRWMAGAVEMRDALAELREAADNANRNYTEAAQHNVDMLS
ncbi:WXG100 family type VII secretion target [Mycolicibacterium arenosum]|uniref:ESAT-6-like protein n=1 Tax=Mycolicibacterium arenosum TaxID=2952157 RepID=A0ABT1M4D3_9MYCO|nr:WXG100 family type VII secretion target [Mycolicibacterium sp. CAU 1645]MCP9274031.1 WXG100 family type VII secretion target [Mycolicibacterium sp. CAU 1645]